MNHIIYAVFEDKKQAKSAIDILKEKGYTEHISVVARDTHHIYSEKDSTVKSTSQGAAWGGILGFLVGATARILPVALPGIGTVGIVGPLALMWGITGSTLGAISGGIAGAMQSLGFSAMAAQIFETSVKTGRILVVLSIPHEKETEVAAFLRKARAIDVQISH